MIYVSDLSEYVKDEVSEEGAEREMRLPQKMTERESYKKGIKFARKSFLR